MEEESEIGSSGHQQLGMKLISSQKCLTNKALITKGKGLASKFC